MHSITCDEIPTAGSTAMQHASDVCRRSLHTNEHAPEREPNNFAGTSQRSPPGSPILTRRTSGASGATRSANGEISGPSSGCVDHITSSCPSTASPVCHCRLHIDYCAVLLCIVLCGRPGHSMLSGGRQRHGSSAAHPTPARARGCRRRRRRCPCSSWAAERGASWEWGPSATSSSSDSRTQPRWH